MNYLQNSIIRRFLDKSKKFCSFIENPQAIYGNEYRQKLRSLVLDLYTVGLQFPKFKIEKKPCESLREEEFKAIVESTPLYFQEQLEGVNYYFEIFDPFDYESDESVTGSIIEEVEELHKSLKTQILKIETGNSALISEAIMTLQFSLKNWQLNRLVDLIRALHYSLDYVPDTSAERKSINL